MKCERARLAKHKQAYQIRQNVVLKTRIREIGLYMYIILEVNKHDADKWMQRIKHIDLYVDI